MGGWGKLVICIYCPPVWTNVSTVMKYLVRHWRINAIRIACFLDDGLGVASSYKMSLFHLNFVKKSLRNAGFIINKEKFVETISKFDLVRNKNKLKKRLLLYTNRKIVSYKKLDCITH